MKEKDNLSEGRDAKARQHRHRGRSSESRMDKGQILSGLSINPGEAVLDAGCGNGYMAKEFARFSGPEGKIYALDIDAEAIEALESETAGTNIEPLLGDITKETRLERSSIDLIYVSAVIHGFSAEQVKGFVREVKRLMRPDGRLAIVEINKEKTPYGPPLEIRFSPEELREAIDLTPADLIDVGPYFYMQKFKK